VIATYEKDLTPSEIQERKLERDELWSSWRQRQGEQSRIAADLRALQRVMREGLGRIHQLQVEIDAGKALVPRQQEFPGNGMVDPVTFGIDGMDEEPEPETKRPGTHSTRYVNGDDSVDPTEGGEPEQLTTYAEFETGHYAAFAQMYPAPKTQHGLGHLLYEVLSTEQAKAFKKGALGTWHPSSAEFQDIAHWARVEKARADSMSSAQRGEPGEGGITIPLPPPMPLKLQQALGSTPKRAKKKSARKPARKAKARK